MAHTTEVEEFSMRKLGIFLLSHPRDVDSERVREAYLLVGIKFQKVTFSRNDWQFVIYKSEFENLIYVSEYNFDESTRRDERRD